MTTERERIAEALERAERNARAIRFNGKDPYIVDRADEVEQAISYVRALLRSEPVGEPVGSVHPDVLIALRSGRAVRTPVDPRQVGGWVTIYAAPPAAPEAKEPERGSEPTRYGHNEVAADLRRLLAASGYDPSTLDNQIYSVARGLGGTSRSYVERHWRCCFDPRALLGTVPTVSASSEEERDG